MYDGGRLITRPRSRGVLPSGRRQLRRGRRSRGQPSERLFVVRFTGRVGLADAEPGGEAVPLAGVVRIRVLGAVESHQAAVTALGEDGHLHEVGAE